MLVFLIIRVIRLVSVSVLRLRDRRDGRLLRVRFWDWLSCLSWILLISRGLRYVLGSGSEVGLSVIVGVG